VTDYWPRMGSGLVSNQPACLSGHDGMAYAGAALSRQPSRRDLRYRSSPRDWGICMSVCIAAICEHSTAIVTVSDRLASWGTDTSSEGAVLKAARLAPTWLTMIAGDDITSGVEDVIRSVRATLHAYGGAVSSEQVQGTLAGAWRDAQNRLAETAVLNPFRMTINQFMQVGRAQFGEAKFIELVGSIQAESKLRCQLLACGFDENKIPSLLACDDASGCHDFTRAGYLAIGSGQSSALASLAFNGYRRETNLSTAIYQACSAKFMSERALGVGHQTLVVCLREDGSTCWIFGRGLDRIRKLWESEGRPRVPAEEKIVEAVAPLIVWAMHSEIQAMDETRKLQRESLEKIKRVAEQQLRQSQQQSDERNESLQKLIREARIDHIDRD
jgi:hypothetical protein